MKIFYKIGICLLLAFAAGAQAQAQLHPGLNLYTQNPFVLNQAFASSDDGIKGILQSTRVLGEFGNNLSLNRFTVQGKVIEEFGVGARVAFANQGEFNSLMADVVASYRTKITEDQSFKAGISLGFIHNAANVTGFQLNAHASADDPVLVRDANAEADALIGAGFIYEIKNAQVALSFPSLTAHEGGPFDQYTALVSYRFDSVQMMPLVLKPIVMHAKQPFARSYSDLSVQATWRDTFWVQPGIRSTGLLMAAFGIKAEEFVVGYGFGLPYGNTGMFNRSLHEVVVSFQFL